MNGLARIDMPTIMDRLRVARRLAGISQDLMACHLEVSQCAYWKLENGKNKKLELIDDLIKIAKECGVSPAWLILGIGEWHDGINPNRRTRM